MPSKMDQPSKDYRIANDERLYVAQLLNEFDLPADLVEVFLTIQQGVLREQWRRRLPEIAETWKALPAGVARSLADVSISGRMALGITCLARYCDAHGDRQPWLDEVINQLWTFVETDDLAKWEEDIWATAGDVLNTTERNRSLDGSRHALISEPMRRMLYEIIAGIGLGNLYGGTAGPSMHTLWPTLKVLKQTMDSGIPVPGLKPFLRSRFSQSHGWGDRVPRSFFKG